MPYAPFLREMSQYEENMICVREETIVACWHGIGLLKGSNGCDGQHDGHCEPGACLPLQRFSKQQPVSETQLERQKGSRVERYEERERAVS